MERHCRRCQRPFRTKPAEVANGNGLYCSHACSNAARARSESDRFWNYVDKTDTCWLWTGAKDRRGYGRFRCGFKINGTRRSETASRFSWALLNGPIPDGLDVCHHCDTPPCVNPAHLFIGTRQDNVDDMIAKGRYRKFPHV